MKRRTSETSAAMLRGNTRRLILSLRELQKLAGMTFSNISTFKTDSQLTTMERDARTAASPPTKRQRRVSGRPSGERSGRKTRNKNQLSGQMGFSSQLKKS